MANRLSRRWDREIVARADRLAQQFGGRRDGTALDRIAEQRQISEVIFRPLLIAGALALREGGFALYVKSNRADASRRLRDFETNGGLGLPPRVRFTIAHEIVHTFLYNLQQSPPTTRLVASSPSTHVKLERACDAGAARLLLPSDRMDRAMTAGLALDPKEVIGFARRAGVSLETLVIRCKTAAWRDRHGGIALVQADGRARPVIRTLATDNYSRGILAVEFAERAMVPRDLASLMKTRTDGRKQRLLAWTSNHAEYRAPVTVDWYRLRSRRPQWIVTLHLDDHPRAVPSGRQR